MATHESAARDLSAVARLTSVERLHEANADWLDALLADTEAEGVRVVRRLIDEWKTGANRFGQPGETLLVARRGSAVVGVCGLNIDPFAEGDPVRVGRVRHLYVLSTHRRRGIGGALVAAVVAAARGHFDRLHLRTANPGAAALYERLGFRRRPDDDHCTHVIDVAGLRAGEDAFKDDQGHTVYVREPRDRA